MKRLSKKLGFSGKHYPQGPWTKYDERLYDGIDNNDMKKVNSAMRKKGVSCVKQDSDGSTALHRGCTQGNTNSVKIMLKAEKPDLTVMDFDGRTPMHVAAQAGHLDCIKCLLHYKSPLDIQDASSMTPLHYAVVRGLEEPVSLMLKCGAPVNIKEKNGRAALTLAVQTENDRMLGLLCDNGAHLNSQDNSGRTALMYASEKGSNNIVKLLLSKGAEPSIKDHNDKSADAFAKASGYDDIVEMLRANLHNGIHMETVNGTNGTTGHDSMSEYDSTIAEDSLTLNSSSSFGEMESISESSPTSPNGFEFCMIEPFDMQKELHSLKTELKNETLKRTKAERELRGLRMQLEIGQGSDEETPIEFQDEDCNFILSEIEKNIPSPLKEISPFEDEDTPLVSSLRGEIGALELQIDRLKKELAELKCNNHNETKIPLTVYKALKESHQKFSDEMKVNLDELQAELKSEKDSRLALEGENKILKEKLNDYKDTLEKNDKKEKIRELNEKIVSLKIELSQMERFKDESEELRDQMETLNADKEAEYKKLKEMITSLESQKRDTIKSYSKKMNGYRRALLSAYQGQLDIKLAKILCEISKIRGCMITEL